MNAEITPLHVRSGYSPLGGTAAPEAIVRRACELGHHRLALSDRNSLCGATVFWKLARAAGLSPIIGAELDDGRIRLLALVAEQEGYENLCRLITRIHGDEGFDLAAGLEELSAGLHLVILDPAAAASLSSLKLPRGRLWVGIDPGPQNRRTVRQLADCADGLGAGLVVTGGAMVLSPDDGDTARLLTAIRLGTTYQNVPAESLPPDGAYLRGGGQLLADASEFPQAATNNRQIAEQCSAFSLLPRKWVFPGFSPPDGKTASEHLRALCRAGMEWRYGGAPPAGAGTRLLRELSLIESKGFCEYFLVVHDIVSYARGRGAPVAGRGSGASSLVAYLLGVTNICPLAFDVPFERFLNERRTDCPDLDIDFCWRIRDEVIGYVFDRWGRGRVAMVCTHNLFQEASAFREAAKAHGLSDEQISVLVRGGDGPDLPAGLLEQIAAQARRLVGLLHNLSVHPGGVVIAPDEIVRHAPIQPSAKVIAPGVALVVQASSPL